MWPGVPLVQSDCRILRLSIYLKSIKSYLSFLHGFIYQGRATLKTTLLGWVWPVFSLVKSDCRTLWSWISLKELIVVLDFLHWDNHEWKIVSETATFSWVLPVVPLVQTNCMILLLPLFLEEIQRKVSIWDYLCWWCVASCTFCPILLQDFLIINISKKNQMISLFFCMDLIIKRRQHQILLFLVGCGHFCLLYNHIVGFFDHQCLWRGYIDVLDFLQGDNQGKATCETTSFGWV